MLLLTPWSAIASSCCRWTPTGACGTNTTRDCTGLHEFLEGKTATHDFESLSCIGSNYAASFDGALGNVSLTSSGAAVAAVPTPLKVTHASDCSATLHLQLDTVVLGNLTVGGLDVAAELAALGASLAAGYDTCVADGWCGASGPMLDVTQAECATAAQTGGYVGYAYEENRSPPCFIFADASEYDCARATEGSDYGVGQRYVCCVVADTTVSGQCVASSPASTTRAFHGDGPLSTNGRCGYVSNEGQERCSALHEYLEEKTTTRVRVPPRLRRVRRGTQLHLVATPHPWPAGL